MLLVAAIAVLSVGRWSLAPPVQAAGEGVIEGQIGNGTANASPPGGILVVLHIVADDSRVERRQVTADVEARYRFEGLDIAPNLKYLPVVEYQGATYYSRPITLADQPRQAADFTVYESTSSDQWIAYERSNLLIQRVAPGRRSDVHWSQCAFRCAPPDTYIRHSARRR